MSATADSKWNRRQVIALGSMAAALPWLPRVAWGETGETEPATGEAVQVLPMSVGYVDGSEGIRDVFRLPPAVRRPGAPTTGVRRQFSVIPAEDVALGDSSMVGLPLRVKVHGLYPPVTLNPARLATLPAAIDLEARFPSPDPQLLPGPLPFYAWSFRRYGPNVAAPVAFTMPAEWEALPEFRLVVRPRTGAVLDFSTRFTVDNEPDRPRLQRGLYLLGLQPDSWQSGLSLARLGRVAPAWRFSILVALEAIRPVQ